MDVEYKDFFEDINELVGPVLDAGFQEFPGALQNWMYQLDNAPDLIKLAMIELVGDADWETVDANCLVPQGGTGNGTLNWPQNPKERLAAQTIVFRQLASGELDVTAFAHEYFHRQHANLNDATQEMSSKLFYQYSKDLNRYLERALRAVPASDRVVPIDHNAAEYEPLVETVEELVEAINESNSIEPDEKSWLIPQLKAGLGLLKAGFARVGALKATIVGGLVAAVSTLKDTAVGKLADTAIEYLMQLVPFLG